MFADVKGPVTVYLSPDQRFITPALYDLAVDPAPEVASISREVNEFLLRDRSPSLAGSKSHINLVEFSDLQCPYCKRFSNWYDSLPDDLKSQTTLIYKHFPLPQHPWARMASIYAACLGTISPAAFWRLTHRLFEIQSEITVGSLNDEVFRVFGSGDDARVKALKVCVDSGAGSTLVDRDIATAKQLAVSATPTVFINGRRVMHIRSEEALEELIRSTLTQQAQLNEKSTASSRSMQ
jgi:protein-disulfide isomerase